MGRPSVARDIRFWQKVNKQKDGCWLWTSSHGQTDYGMLAVKEGEYMAHRISWEIHNGSIPEGMRVLHSCDVRKCVNPDHLFLGTCQDNMDDMVTKGRSLKGTKHPLNKLTEIQVKDIRATYASTNVSQLALAKIYNVDQTLVSAIVRRKIWSHI